jgi:MarR family transcriptional regulator, 2-MHQ and catechol-resistance regulon repressor
MRSIPRQHDLLVGLLLVQSLIERRSEGFFSSFGLTAAQFNILNLLARHEGRLEQAALVELLLVGKSSVSIVLNRMVRDGLVKRAEHPEDRRRTLLNLTAKGKSAWLKILPSYEAGVKEVFGELPLSRRRAFLDDLKFLHDALMKAAGTSPAIAETQWRSLLQPGRRA